MKRQLSRDADPGKPCLGSGHLAWPHLASVLRLPFILPLLPNLGTQFRHSPPVALDVPAKQRLQTVQSAWPVELLCQLTCKGQSQTQLHLFSQLVATAQHAQSLPSPPPALTRQFGRILRLHLKVDDLAVAATLRSLDSNCSHFHCRFRVDQASPSASGFLLDSQAQRPFHRTYLSCVRNTILHKHMDP